MVFSVKFFEGSNVAECPTFEIKFFTLTEHNLSICNVISHISLEGAFGSEVSDVSISSWTFLMFYFQKTAYVNVTFSSVEIKFALKGINTLYYRDTGYLPL